MARPNTTRRSVRVQAPARPRSPGLDVVAPLEVRTPGPETDALWGLGQILGVAGAIGQQVKKEKDESEFKAGQADEMLGKADMERAEKSRKYADGAYQVLILEQYRDAERVVSEKIASELDRGVPLNEQMAVIDGWMKSELGPMVADDDAKLLIAPRYQEFINSVGANILNGQIEDRARRAGEVVQQDAYAELQTTGTINWGEHWARAQSQTGDGTGATAALVGTVAQFMIDRAAAGDPNWADARNAIPTEIVTEDGTVVRGPMFTPKHADTIHRAMLEAERNFHNARDQQYAASEFTARTTLDRMLADGLPITEDTFKALNIPIGNGPEYPMSPALAAQYMQTSEVQRARALEEENEMASWLESRKFWGNWAAAQGMPGGPETKEKTQKAFEAWAMNAMVGMGIDVRALGGQGLVSDPAVVGTIADLSAQEGMVYGPLQRTMSSISQAAPGDLTARMDAYRVLKAKGVASQYLSEDAQLLYEVALGSAEAGMGPEEIADTIRTAGDKATGQHIASQMREVKHRERGFEIKTGNGFFSFGPREINSRDAQNAGYLATKAEQLTMSALAKGLPREKAEEYALERIGRTHTALAIGDNWLVLPDEAIGDARTATEALEWYTDAQLPKLAEKVAKATGRDPASVELTLQGRYDINGRALQIEILDGGVRIPAEIGRPFNLNGLTMVYRQQFPKDRRAEVEAEHRRKQAQKAAPQYVPSNLGRR